MNELERNLFLGADPGQSGGLAIVDRAGMVVDLSKMPDTKKDLSDYVAEFGPRIRMAVLELVHSMPGQGVSSMFKFGRSYGQLEMALVAHGVPFEGVTPQSWQQAMHCGAGGKPGYKATRTQHKNKLKARAQELFPGHKITLATADALLLAEYCRREFAGMKAAGAA